MLSLRRLFQPIIDRYGVDGDDTNTHTHTHTHDHIVAPSLHTHTNINRERDNASLEKHTIQKLIPNRKHSSRACTYNDLSSIPRCERRKVGTRPRSMLRIHLQLNFAHTCFQYNHTHFVTLSLSRTRTSTLLPSHTPLQPLLPPTLYSIEIGGNDSRRRRRHRHRRRGSRGRNCGKEYEEELSGAVCECCAVCERVCELVVNGRSSRQVRESRGSWICVSVGERESDTCVSTWRR